MMGMEDREKGWKRIEERERERGFRKLEQREKEIGGGKQTGIKERQIG